MPATNKPRWRKSGIAVNDQYPKTIFDCDDGRREYCYFDVGDEAGVSNYIARLNGETTMGEVKIGSVVWYKPSFKDPKFHDKGGRDILPAVVVKVWDAVVDVQVITHPEARLDLHVLQDATCPLAFVPFVKRGSAVGEWSFPE